MTIAQPSSTYYELMNLGFTSVTNYTLLQNSTKPMTGKFIVKTTRANGDEVSTVNLAHDTLPGHIEREIYRAAPEFLGALKIQRIYGTFPTASEGIELIYKVAPGFNVELELGSSETAPLAIPDSPDRRVNIEKTSFIDSSDKVFYETIPAGYLRTVERSPQAIVTTNGMRSACPLTPFCDLQFIDDVAEITDIQYTIDSITYPWMSVHVTGTGIPVDELMTVTIGQHRLCIIDYGTTLIETELTCTVEEPLSGDNLIQVQTKKGALKKAASTSEFDLAINVTGIAPMTIGRNGGAKITIDGDYFPLSKEEASEIDDFEIKIGDKPAKLFSSSRKQMIAIVLGEFEVTDTPSLTITFNGKTYTHSTPFTVSAAPGSVQSVSPVAVSPPIKQDLVIEVSTLPSSDPNDYIGVLDGPDVDLLRMKVRTIDTGSSTLTVRYPGSPKNAEYKVYIEYNGERYDSSVTLQATSYITGFTIDTVGDPKEMISTTGGDKVTVQGHGFSTNKEEMIVQFGDATATVIESTFDSVTVRAAPFEDGKTEIKVFILYAIEAGCQMADGCNITYDATQAPTLAEPDTFLIPNVDTVTITGTGFGANPSAFIEGLLQKTVSASDTEIVVKLTNMNNNEMFTLEVRTETVNLPMVYVQLPFTAELVSISPHTGSKGGELLTLSTIGIGLQYTSDHFVYYGSGSSAVKVCTKVILINSSTLQCLTAHDLTVPLNSILKLSYKHKSFTTGKLTDVILSCLTESDCHYHTDAALTPTVTFAQSGNTATATLAGVTFDNSVTYTTKLHMGNLNKDGTLSTGDNSVTAEFSEGLPPGKSLVRVEIKELNGRHYFTSPINATVALSASTSTVSSCSWNGG
jgi:hypothetical protein